MAHSCKCILDHLLYKSAITVKEYDKILRNIKTDWIPVTERLPEKEGAYLVTERYEGMKKPCYVMREWYVNGRWSRVDTLGMEVTAWIYVTERIKGMV